MHACDQAAVDEVDVVKVLGLKAKGDDLKEELDGRDLCKDL